MRSIREILGRQTIHPFPARMSPDIALNVLSASRQKKSLKVLDPMVGSGTVLAVARANGHRAIGIDCDPLSVLLAKTWTSPGVRWVARARLNVILVACSLGLVRLELTRCNVS